MPLSDWLKRITREKARDFLIAPLDETHGAPKRAAVQVDAEYVTLRIKAARIVDVRRWTSRFHGWINSRARLLHEGSGSVEHQTVLAPAELKEVDPAGTGGPEPGIVASTWPESASGKWHTPFRA